ncbi:MAG: hypothetical protein R3F13_15825 [Prosthecobacter sp.]
MKPPSENHDLIRWLDGEMTDAERAAFEGEMKADPALAKEAEEMRSLSASLRTHLPAEMKVPHADFFNSQIQMRIAQLEMEDSRQKPESSLESIFALFRQPWLAAASAVAVVVAGFLMIGPGGTDSEHSLILSSYTPGRGVEASTYHDSAADATVLMLDGLDEVPADRKISGISVHRSETEPEVAATTLFDAAGAPLLVISRDAAGHPLFLRNHPRG